MKKILFVLLILFIPSVVLADSVSPQIMGYEAVIINKKGITYEDSEQIHTVAYNTKIYVKNEYDDNEAYACLSSDTNECFEVSTKDISPVKKEVVPKDLLKKDNDGTTVNSRDTKLLIYNKKGEKLKKGPADAYGTYDATIPFKQVVKVTYAVHYTGHGGGDSWYYVEDGKYKGWISSEEDVAAYYNDSVLMFKDVKLYSIDTNEVIATIPAETEITNYYKSALVYFTYKDNFGYIKTSESEKDYDRQSFGYKSKLGYILTIKSTEMKSKGKTVTAIPKGEKIKILYGYYEDVEEVDAPTYSTGSICIEKKDCYYYIEYNGVKGFVADDNNIISLDILTKQKTVSYTEDKVVYDGTYYLDEYEKLYEGKMPIEEYSKLHETGDTLTAGTKVTYYMSSYITDYSKDDEVLYGNKGYEIHLIKYGNNKVGWIIESENDSRVFDEGKNNQPGIPSESKNDQPSVTPKEDKNLMTIILYVGVAIAISAIAIVTIIIVNKNKKIRKVKNEIKEDKKNEG